MRSRSEDRLESLNDLRHAFGDLGKVWEGVDPAHRQPPAREGILLHTHFWLGSSRRDVDLGPLCAVGEPKPRKPNLRIADDAINADHGSGCSDCHGAGDSDSEVEG